MHNYSEHAIVHPPGKPIALHLLVRDHDGHPHVRCKFQIRSGELLLEGVTTDAGYVDAKFPLCDEAQLTVTGADHDDSYSLVFSKPEPLSTLKGVQHALMILGYFCEDTGLLDSDTQHAISEFQSHEGLTATGQPDDALRAHMKTLMEAH